MYTAGVIQVHMCHHTARLQYCSRSLDKVDTTRLLHSQSHHHLHHLNPPHKQPVKENTKRSDVSYEIRGVVHFTKSCQSHLNLSVGLSRKNVASIFN